jgi:hypothetical protein
MAQSGFTPIQLYRSATPAAVATAGNLLFGELFLNYADGNLFFKDSSNAVRLLASTAAATGTVSSVNASGGTTGLTFTGGPVTTTGTLTLGGTLAVANGGTGATSSTGSGSVVLQSNATLGGVTLSANAVGGTAGNTSVPLTTTSIAGSNDLRNLLVNERVSAGSDWTTTRSRLVGRVDTTDQTYIDLRTAGAAPGIAFGTGGPGVVFERMRIDQSGNVGIGTATPGVRLDVVGPALTPATQNTYAMWVANSGGANGDLAFGSTSGAALVQSFGAKPLRINGIGNAVVVGGNPAAVYSGLTVSTDIAIQQAQPLFNFVNAAGSTRFGYIFHTGVGGSFDILNQQNGPMTFGTNNLERVRIDASGNVGIGTTTPTGRLSVVSATNGEVFRAQKSGGTNLTLLRVNMDDTANTGTIEVTGAAGTPALAFATAGSERMRIDATGNVGVGRSNPQALFDVQGSMIARNDVNGYAFFAPKNGTDPFGANYDRFEIRVNPSSQVTELGNVNGGTGSPRALAFYTAASERMRIDTNGNVGIGTSSPATALHVAGTGLTLGTALTIANGGTGATDAAGARAALGAAASGAVGSSGLTMTTARILGRTTASTGAVEEITVGSGLSLSGGTLTATGGGTGTVTSVSGTGTVNGITLTGTVTSSGNLTLGGTLSGVSLTTQVTGTLPIANGGTGATSAANALTSLGAYPASNPNGFTSNAGTVTSVSGTGSANGLSLSGTVTSSGNITLGGSVTSVAANATIDGVTIGFRNIPRSTTATTAVVGDVGRCIAATAGITIPNATFAAGDAVSIYNDSGSAITITQGASLTLRQAGTANTGNRTLAARGMATVWFNSSSEAIISGAGVT